MTAKLMRSCVFLVGFGAMAARFGGLLTPLLGLLVSKNTSLV